MDSEVTRLRSALEQARRRLEMLCNYKQSGASDTDCIIGKRSPCYICETVATIDAALRTGASEPRADEVPAKLIDTMRHKDGGHCPDGEKRTTCKRAHLYLPPDRAALSSPPPVVPAPVKRLCIDCKVNEADECFTVCGPCWEKAYRRADAPAPAVGVQVTPVPHMAAWPADQPKRYNACTDPCDMWTGPCACGAWHREGK